MIRPKTEEQLAKARERQRRYEARKRGEDIPLRPAGRPRKKERQEIEADFIAARAAVDAAYARGEEPTPEEIARYYEKLRPAENVIGRPFRHIPGSFYPWRPELGQAWLWQPGHRAVYLGPAGDKARLWRIDAKAPRWTAWAPEPGAGPPPEDAVYLEAEPGRRAAPGEMVLDIHRIPVFNEYGAVDTAARALFHGLDIAVAREELRPELAATFRAAAVHPRVAGDSEHSRTLLESAADMIERRGTCRLGENGIE